MNMRNKLMISGAVLCAALFLFAGFMLLREYHDGQQSTEAFEKHEVTEVHDIEN